MDVGVETAVSMRQAGGQAQVPKADLRGAVVSTHEVRDARLVRACVCAYVCMYVFASPLLLVTCLNWYMLAIDVRRVVPSKTSGKQEVDTGMCCMYACTYVRWFVRPVVRSFECFRECTYVQR